MPKIQYNPLSQDRSEVQPTIQFEGKIIQGFPSDLARMIQDKFPKCWISEQYNPLIGEADLDRPFAVTVLVNDGVLDQDAAVVRGTCAHLSIIQRAINN
jgi:hypothetical protein